MMKRVFKLSVHELLSRTCREGDLRSEFSINSRNRAQQGIVVHKRIQKERGEDYTAEYPVSWTCPCKSYDILLQGRIDGVFHSSDAEILFTIEEIKTSSKDIEHFLHEEQYWHQWQARVYAYLYYLEKKDSQNWNDEDAEVKILYTYVQLDTKEQKELCETLTLSALGACVQQILGKLAKQLDQQLAWEKQRNTSIENMDFPLEFREGQYTMAATVFRAIRDAESLLVQAPTGIGKTLAAVFPAVKAMSTESFEKIFFFSARNTGKQAAVRALQQLCEHGFHLRVLVLTAKERLCPNAVFHCHPDSCVMAHNYYTKRMKLLDAQRISAIYEQATLLDIAARYELCPFELSLDLSYSCDVIICDYNYLIDPFVSLKRYFPGLDLSIKNDKKKAATEQPYVFLFDEAHNLVDRSRAVFSMSISKNDILHWKKVLVPEFPSLKRCLTQINTYFLKLASELNQKNLENILPFEVDPEAERELLCRFQGSEGRKSRPEGFQKLIHKASHTCETILAQNLQLTDSGKALLDMYFTFNRFLRLYDLYASNYCTVLHSSDVKQKNSMKLSLFCSDASSFLLKYFQYARSCIMFSATLTPFPYFAKLIFHEEPVRTLAVVSPYSKKNRLAVAIPYISTLYKHRDESCQAICNSIVSVLQSRRGKYFVFFSSYAHLSAVYQQFIETCEKELSSYTFLVQEHNMAEAEREQFLENFYSSKQEACCAFVVLGGIFSESIDLLGTSLIGAILVGVGLPALSLEQELIKTYFDQEYGQGFEMSYQIPGMNKILQAAGRVIRSAEDTGVLVFIGKRYTQWSYKRLLHAYEPLSICSAPQELEEKLKQFWTQSVLTE